MQHSILDWILEWIKILVENLLKLNKVYSLVNRAVPMLILGLHGTCIKMCI